MTAQIRNAQNVELLSADLQARYEPQFALANSEALHCQLPALRAFWPMGPNTVVGGDVFAADMACGFDIELISAPLFSRYNLAPYMDFTAVTSQYLEFVDDVQFDILGSEAYVANPGLTLGGWFWCDAPSMGAQVGFIAKYDVTANQRAYALYKFTTDLVTMLVSTDGVNNVIIAHTTAMVVNSWNHVVGRFTPSTELAIFLNNVKVTNVAAIPASVFNSSASLRVGDIRATYLDGRASQCFICASALSDALIGNLYQQSRAMFGV
jgi:hypothetical protein